MTIAPILDDDGVQILSFYLEGVQQVVPYEHVRELLGFHKGAPEKVDVSPDMLAGFWNMISGEAHQQRNCIRNPIIRIFLSWMCKRVLGRMKETKVTDTELNWLYSALIARQPIDPSYLMINRWCCEATSGWKILVRGATSPCWPSPYDRGSQETPTIFCVVPLSVLSICGEANTLVEMREEVIGWP
jgi:hypothetical protein